MRWLLLGLLSSGLALSLAAQTRATAGEPTNLEAWWADLADEDAGRAYRAMWAFVGRPKESIAFFEKHLRPAVAPDKSRVEALINDLSSQHFAVRSKANSELEKLGDVAAPALRRALNHDNLALEARQRVEKLIKNLHGPVKAPETLRAIRAVEAMEYIGVAQAFKLLDKLARGAPGARLTVEAQETLGRMKR